MSEAHSKASKKRMMRYTQKERSERARKMVLARWSKVSKKKRVEFVKTVLIPAQSRFKNK